MTHQYFCRFCHTELGHTFVDLGLTPLSNAYLDKKQLEQEEPAYPLKVYVCSNCFLVQLPEFQSPENIFADYAYFSSYSDSWLMHAREYTQLMLQRFQYGPDSLVMEIASNDGYLLQYFSQHKIPVLGIEPAGNVARVANQANIPTMVRFFGTSLATELAAQNRKADLLIGNNVLAHVPDLNDFVQGMKRVLKDDGVATLEFPHLLKLVEGNQFDTIYHEHFSYFSFHTAVHVFAKHGLTVFDVQELSTHGGSLRVFVGHTTDRTKKMTQSVGELIDREKQAGMDSLAFYSAFDRQVKKTKHRIREFLVQAKKEKKTIAGYGAPAKGNTLLNYCRIGTELISYTVDKNPVKQGRYLPGTHIPIFPPEKIQETQPDYVVILPWNLKDEIMDQMSCIHNWSGKFVTFIPEPAICP
mgnify:FL=1